jgi:hypothetical protein
VPRPASVLIWAHVDQPDTLLEVVGWSATSQVSADLLPYLEHVDMRQPMDLVLVSQTGKLRDVEPVLRLHIREAKALFARLATTHEIREDGNRVFGRPKGGTEDAADVWACSFSAGAGAAVCGGPKAVDGVAEWLEPGPTLPKTEAKNPTLRVFAYRKPLAALAAQLIDRKRDVDELFEDVERFDLELVADGEELDVVGTLRLHSGRSATARDLLTKANDVPSPAAMLAFDRIAQEGGAAVFSPGGGSIPKWIAEVVRESQPASTRTNSFPDPHPDEAAVVGSFMTQPAALGYRMRIDRAKKALTDARTSKNIEKGTRELDDALEPRFVYALSAQAADVERALRAIASSSRRSVRTASAGLGLPKGSFFFDERLTDTSTSGTRFTHTLFAPAATLLWGVDCATEDACVEAMKRLTSTTPPPTADNDLFHQPGILAAGYLPSFVQIAPSTRILLRSVGGSSPTRADVLTNIERELGAPPSRLPFVLRTSREGDGGTVALRMRGSASAFRTMVEHGVLGSSWVLARVLAAVFGPG